MRIGIGMQGCERLAAIQPFAERPAAAEVGADTFGAGRHSGVAHRVERSVAQGGVGKRPQVQDRCGQYVVAVVDRLENGDGELAGRSLGGVAEAGQLQGAPEAAVQPVAGGAGVRLAGAEGVLDDAQAELVREEAEDETGGIGGGGRRRGWRVGVRVAAAERRMCFGGRRVGPLGGCAGVGVLHGAADGRAGRRRKVEYGMRRRLRKPKDTRRGKSTPAVGRSRDPVGAGSLDAGPPLTW